MRIYYIALAIFCFNIAMQMVAASGLYPYYSVQASQGWDTAVKKYENASYATGGISQESLKFGFGDFVRALSMFVELIWNSVMGTGMMLSLLAPEWFGPNAPGAHITEFVNNLILFIYGVGIIQFISGRAFKQNA